MTLECCEGCHWPLCPVCADHLEVCDECLSEFVCSCGWTGSLEAYGFSVVNVERQTVGHG